MKKSTRKFLFKRIKKQTRNELCWIYIVPVEDERVYLSGDGYAMHLDWSFDPQDPYLELDDCWVVPTSTKCMWRKTHANFYNKLTEKLTLMTTTHNKCVIEFAPYAFQQRVKNFPHEMIFIHVTPDRQVYFTHEDVIFKVETINVTLERALEDTFEMAVSKELLKKSYKSVDSMMVIDVDRPEAPIQLGTWGERLAILMPMAISGAGFPKGLRKLVDEVADLLSDAEQAEPVPDETEAF